MWRYPLCFRIILLILSLPKSVFQQKKNCQHLTKKIHFLFRENLSIRPLKDFPKCAIIPLMEKDEIVYTITNKTAFKILKARKQILELQHQGKTYREIAKKVGVSFSSLSKYKKLWRDDELHE